MKYKNYKDEIKESNFGVIIEGENIGKHSYVENPEIKEIEIDGKFIANKGYNLDKVKETEIKQIEWQIVEQEKNKNASSGLTIEADIDAKILKLKEDKKAVEDL